MPSFVYKFVTTKETAESISDCVLEAGLFDTQATSVLEDEENKTWICELYFPDKPDEAELLQFLSQQGFDTNSFKGSLIELDDIDWVAHSLEGLPPVSVGYYFIHGRHDSHHVSPYHIPVLVEASQAFGTGHHATTEGCLHLMQHVKKQKQVKRILDVGCGSAVLTIAAAKDFKAKVIGTEIDPVSAQIAEINCNVNHVTHSSKILCQADLKNTAELAGGKFDLIIANILAKPLIHLSSEIVSKLDHKGHLILSGLLVHQEVMVVNAYRRFGFKLEKRYNNGEWLALLLTKI